MLKIFLRTCGFFLRLPPLDEAAPALDRHRGYWGDRDIRRSGQEAGAPIEVRLTMLFGLPPVRRKVTDAANAIESLSYPLRKVSRNRGAFPDGQSIQKNSCPALQKRPEEVGSSYF